MALIAVDTAAVPGPGRGNTALLHCSCRGPRVTPAVACCCVSKHTHDIPAMCIFVHLHAMPSWLLALHACMYAGLSLPSSTLLWTCRGDYLIGACVCFKMCVSLVPEAYLVLGCSCQLVLRSPGPVCQVTRTGMRKSAYLPYWCRLVVYQVHKIETVCATCSRLHANTTHRSSSHQVYNSCANLAVAAQITASLVNLSRQATCNYLFLISASDMTADTHRPMQVQRQHAAQPCGHYRCTNTN
jgi:hypothetical protein